MSNRVLCFGEALIDFLSTGNAEDDGLKLPSFRQYPGGAPANAAVAVAKLGGDARFAGLVGNDKFGDFLAEALVRYGVDISLLGRHETAPTSLAFVHLDDTGDRSFSFYRDGGADTLFDAAAVDNSWFENTAILHLCSNTLTTPQSAEATLEIADRALEANVTVCVDVNLRHNLWPQGKACKETVMCLVSKAQVLKFAKEELEYLAGAGTAQFIDMLLNLGCQLVMVTDGGNPVTAYTGRRSLTLQPPRVKVVDTTAGGDGFIGGLLYRIAKSGLESLLADEALLKQALIFAIACGALAVSRPGAFPALPVLAEAEDFSAQLGVQFAAKAFNDIAF
ncbi:carbohydrate kinase [Shewanella sp. JM162201]|uniref:Carbohydrate kinase n=1 Tax=Shewanella jiangmenensis TaxID=2837387 RepID=A0ABS5V595_9GAMM|nr:carbohydrate kinase [Shewanella jiangmenensis]MBT1444223.1 carbohydrate kinase [Shewanella jiangmenensis]